jgi:hypothetical protein
MARVWKVARLEHDLILISSSQIYAYRSFVIQVLQSRRRRRLRVHFASEDVERRLLQSEEEDVRAPQVGAMYSGPAERDLSPASAYMVDQNPVWGSLDGAISSHLLAWNLQIPRQGSGNGNHDIVLGPFVAMRKVAISPCRMAVCSLTRA